VVVELECESQDSEFPGAGEPILTDGCSDPLLRLVHRLARASQEVGVENVRDHRAAVRLERGDRPIRPFILSAAESEHGEPAPRL
jgi:hypothetical protein